MTSAINETLIQDSARVRDFDSPFLRHRQNRAVHRLILVLDPAPSDWHRGRAATCGSVLSRSRFTSTKPRSQDFRPCHFASTFCRHSYESHSYSPHFRPGVPGGDLCRRNLRRAETSSGQLGDARDRATLAECRSLMCSWM